MNPLAEPLLDACAETVMAVDPETQCIVTANRQAVDLLGYPLSELIGRPIADIEVGLQDMFFWEEVKNGTRQECHCVEGEYRHASGMQIAVQKTVRLIESGERQLFVISVHDISASKQLEDETARTASLLAATLESTVDGILVTSLSGGIRHFNHRFAEMWRLPMTLFGQEDEPRLLKHLLHQLADPMAFREWFENLLAKPQAEATSECRLLDGRVFGLSSRPQRLRDRPIGRVFSFHDITSLKATETQLIAARDAAQAASRAKSEFLSHMSHELRTPLNAILGFGKVLEDDLDGPLQSVAQHISKAGRHLLELINEVLDLASIEAGKMKLELRPIDLADLVHDCTSLVAPLATARGIELHVTPISRHRFVVQADSRRLKQMVLNLLSNAIKYNRENGRVEVTVTAQGNDYWRLTVIDTGIGITNKDQTQLFEPFSRVGNQQQEIEGAGIGLALTRKLARQMNGQIGMESQPGIGSRFWIDLPCAEAASIAAMSSPVPDDAAIAAAGDTITLLYIEDDALSQKLLATVLGRKRPNYNLFCANTGAKGLELAQKVKPKLILLDQQLPDGDGIDLFKLLRNLPEITDIPIVALSGNASQEDISKTMAAGFADYITKPLQIDQTLSLIDKLLTEVLAREALE